MLQSIASATKYVGLCRAIIRLPIVIGLTIALPLIVHGATSAAEPVLTTVTGVVSDGNGKPIPRATVIFASTTEKATTHSANDGTFSMKLPTGTYRLAVRAEGFDVATREVLTVGSQPLNLQVTLVGSGSLKTIASVSVERQSAINVTPAAINTITSQDIAAQGSIGLSRVLSEIPGVQITMANMVGNGAQEYAVDSPANAIYLQIRGSQPYENAVLYDGHRINSVNWAGIDGATNAGSGTFNLGYLDTNSLSSLDIVKGPGADSPTINNAIGGVADINPLIATGPPSATLSYGTDGNGGLQFNLTAQGETKNKRFGITATATSYALSGPIGGFPYLELSSDGQSSFDLGVLANGELVAGAGNPGSTGRQYLPSYISGNTFYTTTISTLACCNIKATRDTTIEQQRTIGASYNFTPKLQVTLRYALNNSLSDLSLGPTFNIFQPVAGYTGKIPEGAQFFTEGVGSFASREIDQLYEWDVHAQIGKAFARASYLSYSSSNLQNGNSGTTVCSPCTISGEMLVGGTLNLPQNFGTCGNSTCGTATIFNDQNVGSITPVDSQISLLASETLTHDLVVDLRYPLSSTTTAGLSYNSTVTSTRWSQVFGYIVSPLVGGNAALAAFGCPLPLPSLYPSSPSGFERFTTLHGSISTMLAKNLSGEFSYYANQYQYYIPTDWFVTNNSFKNVYSYFATPRFGFEWRPSVDLAVRASAGSSISPIDERNLIGSSQVPSPNPCPPLPPLSYTVQLTNPTLKAETSFGEDLGASLRVDHYDTISADIYNTTLHGQFFTNYQQDGTYRGLPLYATQTRNLAHSKYQGFELTITSHPPIGLFWTLQGSLQRAFAYDIPASFYTSSGGAYSTNLSIVANQNFSGGQNGIGRVAYAQGYAAVGWSNRRGFQISSNFTYYGNNNGLFRPPFITVDLDSVIPLTSQTSLTVAVANLTNLYAPLYLYQSPTAYAIIPYAHVTTNGYIGCATGAANLGPRHLSATFNMRL